MKIIYDHFQGWTEDILLNYLSRYFVRSAPLYSYNNTNQLNSVISCSSCMIVRRWKVQDSELPDYTDWRFFPLALQPILGLDHLHETPHFTSVTRSRTVDRTQWADNQLIARPLPVHTQKKRTHNTNTKYSCARRDSNTWSQRPSERRQCLRPFGCHDWH
jgi:hypothetical protein